MESKNIAGIIYDHNEGGLNYRTLADKYGISRTEVHRIVMSKHNKPKKTKELARELRAEDPLPDDVEQLKKELRDARLLIQLQDFMIDISSKELGIDLRKKHGAKRPK